MPTKKAEELINFAPKHATLINKIEAFIGEEKAVRKIGARIVSCWDGDVVLGYLPEDGRPFIKRWNVEELGPWPSTSDGFTKYQLQNKPE